MRRLAVFIVVLANCLLLFVSAAEAAKKKQPAPVVKKPIYEAPMRVVIVRNTSSVCEPSCPEWIAAEGEITSGTPAAFRKVLKQMGKKKLPVIIRSPGGSINAALEVGKMLRERQMTVAVGYTRFTGCAPDDQKCKLPKESKGIYDGQIQEYGAFCNSACPMLLSGGTTRLASSLTYIGLHEPKTVWTRTQVRYRDHYRIVKGKKKVTKRQILSRKTLYDKTTYGFDKRLRKRLTAYYKTMGVDVATLDESMKAKYQDINYIADDLKSKLGLRTSNQSATLLGNPKLCGSSTSGIVCVEDKARDPKLKAVAQQKLIGLDDTSKFMTFQLVAFETGNCTTNCPKMIVADGRIGATTQDSFVTFLNSVKPGPALVVLNSDGGDLSAALHMAQRIRLAGLSTSVAELKNKRQRVTASDIGAGSCKGVCAVVFAGGVSRSLAEKQQIELYHLDLLAGGSVPKTELMGSTLVMLGVKTELMADLKKLKRDKRLAITSKEAVQYQLATVTRPVGAAAVQTDCGDKGFAPECQQVGASSLRAQAQQQPVGESEMKPIIVVAEASTCRPNCPAWIAASGTITKETQRRFASLLSRASHLELPIILNSKGGNGAAAIEIAKVIRSKRLTVVLGDTQVTGCLYPQDCGVDRAIQGYFTGTASEPGRCEGACLLLFAGGHARSAVSRSPIDSPFVLLGSADMGVTPDRERAQKVVEEHFRLLGFSKRIADIFHNTAAGSRHTLSMDEFSDAGLANSIKNVRGITSYQSCAVIPRPRNCVTVAVTQ